MFLECSLAGTFDIKSDLIEIRHLSSPRLVQVSGKTVYNKEEFTLEVGNDIWMAQVP
jgi:hypothetical protein